MKIKDAVSELKQDRIHQYYMIAGAEEFLRDLALKSILPLLKIQMEEWNISMVRDGESLIGNLESLPMMSERRAVICDVGDIPENVAGRLASYLPVMPKSTVLILTKSSAPEKKRPLDKFMIEKGAVVDCASPSESESIDFLCAYAAKDGIKLSRSNAHTFYRHVSGADLGHLVSELGKLVAVVDGEITQQDIQKYTVFSSDYNIFKLHDLILSKQWKKAESLLTEIFDKDASPIGLISILTSNFELMLIARACLDAGYPETRTKKNIMEAAKVAEFRAKKAIAQSRQMNAQDIRGAIRKLAKLDFDAKQGNVMLRNDLYAVLLNIYTETV